MGSWEATGVGDGKGKDCAGVEEEGEGEGLLRRGPFEVVPSVVASASGFEGNASEEGDVAGFVVKEFVDVGATKLAAVVGEILVVDEGKGMEGVAVEAGGARVKTVAVLVVTATDGSAGVAAGDTATGTAD